MKHLKIKHPPNDARLKYYELVLIKVILVTGIGEKGNFIEVEVN